MNFVLVMGSYGCSVTFNLELKVYEARRALHIWNYLVSSSHGVRTTFSRATYGQRATSYGDRENVSTFS